MNLTDLAFVPFHIAPGVYIRVIAEPLPNVSHPNKYNALFFIAADKGPANELVFITNQQQFIDTFGAPKLEYPWSSIYAYYWSQYANAICVRLLPYDATESNIALAFITKSDTNNNLISDTNGRYIFTIAAGYLSDSTFTVQYCADSSQIGKVLPIGDILSTTLTQPVAFDFAKLSGNGPYYNNINYYFTPATQFGNLNMYIRYNDSTIFSLNNISFEPNTDMVGVSTQLTTNKLNGTVNYTFNELNYSAVIQGKLGIGNTSYVIEYYKRQDATSTATKTIAEPSDTLTISSLEVLYTLNTSSLNMSGGSNGSLISINGRFNYRVFAQLVKEAVYGISRMTGNNNAYLKEPIYSLLDDTYPFIKYVFDPTDYGRFVPNDIQSVQSALHDYVLNKWFVNQGALLIANVAPIYNPFNLAEIAEKQFFNSYLVSAYCSEIDGVLYGYRQKWPQIAFVARDLVKLRAGNYSVLPFAGPMNAPHSGAINLPRKYTLSEKDQLVLYGINFATKDIDYGIYTDLDRTTTATATMLRWMYVVEDLIDLKYETQKLLKQYLHQLETFDWDSVANQIKQVILKPRKQQGLVTDYDVVIVKDPEYLNQNVLPVIIRVKYAREIERISVTIYVQ